MSDRTTPQLVRELISLKMADARGDCFGIIEHNRLTAVCNELRRRGVLD